MCYRPHFWKIFKILIQTISQTPFTKNSKKQSSLIKVNFIQYQGQKHFDFRRNVGTTEQEKSNREQ